MTTTAPATPNRASVEEIGEFLEAIDFSGSVSREVLATYAGLVTAVRPIGSRPWQAAVTLTATAPGKRPPSPVALRDYLAAQASQAARPKPAPSAERGESKRPAQGQYQQNQRKRAVLLLEEAGLTAPIAEDVLDAYQSLASAAGRPGLKRWSTAVRMVRAAGCSIENAPGPDALRERFDVIVAAAKRKRERRLERAAGLRERAEADADEAVAYVAKIRAETGGGPTWRELGHHLGWKPLDVVEIGVKRLLELGVLTSTTEHRSLDVAAE